MALSNAVIAEIDERAVTFLYLDRATAKYWNERRGEGEPTVFCGWYWAKGGTEAGPFKTRQAAMRDAWYHLVQRMAPPSVRRAGRPTKRPTLRLTYSAQAAA